MKKLIAVMLALVLALGLGCAALAENAETPEITNDNWLLKSLTDTDWIQKNGRATLEIHPFMDDLSDDYFKVILHWADSDSQAAEWTYYGTFDSEIKVLNLHQELLYEVTYGEGGEMELSRNIYDRECDVTLGMDDDGLLILSGSEEEQISLMGFEPLPAVQEKVAALTDRDTQIFTQATEKLLGVNYEPIGVLDEADDMVFCFLCKATVVVPGAEPAYCLAIVYNISLDGPEIEFIQIMEDGSEG